MFVNLHKHSKTLSYFFLSLSNSLTHSSCPVFHFPSTTSPSFVHSHITICSHLQLCLKFFGLSLHLAPKSLALRPSAPIYKWLSGPNTEPLGLLSSPLLSRLAKWVLDHGPRRYFKTSRRGLENPWPHFLADSSQHLAGC